ncbi:MAG: hypothetical protein E3J96_03660 [Sulfurovum sp.]|nr:MAG: hypothetical protein E3J96_03660 [Sulfurovum sp.]
MKTIILSLFTVLLLTGCSPRIGFGLGGATSIGSSGIATSEVHVDDTGHVHGSVGIGTDTWL